MESLNNLLNFYNLTTTELSAAVIVFNIVLTFLLTMAIVWLYRRTHQGLSYSQSFLITLVMVGLLGAMAMMIVQQNLVGAFALLGTFSLIRFRTIVKDTKDVVFVFFSLLEGVAVGTNNYSIALIALILISGILLWMHRMRFGSALKSGFILMVQASRGLDGGKMKSIIENYAPKSQPLHIKNIGEEMEYSFALRLGSDKNPEDLVRDLRNISGVISIDLMTGKESVEY